MFFSENNRYSTEFITRDGNAHLIFILKRGDHYDGFARISKIDHNFDVAENCDGNATLSTVKDSKDVQSVSLASEGAQEFKYFSKSTSSGRNALHQFDCTTREKSIHLELLESY